jgi:hypothetical protein
MVNRSKQIQRYVQRAPGKSSSLPAAVQTKPYTKRSRTKKAAQNRNICELIAVVSIRTIRRSVKFMEAIARRTSRTAGGRAPFIQLADLIGQRRFRTVSIVSGLWQLIRFSLRNVSRRTRKNISNRSEFLQSVRWGGAGVAGHQSLDVMEQLTRVRDQCHAIGFATRVRTSPAAAAAASAATDIASGEFSAGAPVACDRVNRLVK